MSLRSWGVAAALFGAALLGPAAGRAAATCVGDCNSDGSVTIDELVTAVAIALGDTPTVQCSAADVDGNGKLTIDELVAAVGSALNGCAPPARAALMASASAAVEPIDGVYDFGRVGAGGVGGAIGARALMAAAGRPAGISGCQTFPCSLFGTPTGSEEVCCFSNQYTITDTSCSFDDESGNEIDRDGFVSLTTDSAEVCSGFVPVGESFTLEFSDFFSNTIDPSGNFAASNSTFTETFESAPGAGCTQQQPDRFGLGVRGDGVRTLDGKTRLIVGDGNGNTTTDLATEASGLQIQVASLLDNNQQCQVGAQLDGDVHTTDFMSRAQFATSYTAFQVFELSNADGTLYLDYEGTVGTDCLGTVDITTDEFLQLRPGDACLTAGRLRLELQDGTTEVEYTPSGGVAYDFGADGSVDEQLASCMDLTLEVCTANQIAGLCATCNSDGDCPQNLGCFDCAFDCPGNQPRRCSLPDDYVTCDDGVF